MKLVFFGTSSFALPAFEALCASDQEIIAVVTQPDRKAGRGQKVKLSPIKSRAQELARPLLQPEQLRDPAALHLLSVYKADLFVVVAYGQLLPPKVLALPRLGTINLHGSLLPAYRGAAPIQRAILAGETNTGLTTMWLSPGLDEGDIILQQTLSIGARETYGELQKRLAAAGGGLLLKTLQAVEQDRAPRRPQDPARASYAPTIKSEETRIDWQKTAPQINNLIRALNPKPGAYCLWRENRLKLWQGEIVSGVEGIPGELVEFTKEGPIIATGQEGLRLLRLQLAGRNAISGAEFLRGYAPQVGESFR